VNRFVTSSYWLVSAKGGDFHTVRGTTTLFPRNSVLYESPLGAPGDRILALRGPFIENTCLYLNLERPSFDGAFLRSWKSDYTIEKNERRSGVRVPAGCGGGVPICVDVVVIKADGVGKGSSLRNGHQS